MHRVKCSVSSCIRRTNIGVTADPEYSGRSDTNLRAGFLVVKIEIYFTLVYPSYHRHGRGSGRGVS